MKQNFINKIFISLITINLISCQNINPTVLPSIEPTSTFVELTPNLVSPTSTIAEQSCFEKNSFEQIGDFEGTIFSANQNNIYSYSNTSTEIIGNINEVTNTSRSLNNQIVAVLDAKSKTILLLESGKSPINIDAHPLIGDYIRWQGDQKLFYIIKAADGEPFKYFEFNISTMEGVEKNPWTTNMYPKIEFSPLENKYVDLAFSPELMSDWFLLIDLDTFRSGWAIELNDPQNAIYRWSPDGKLILLVDKRDINNENYALYTIDMNGTKKVLVEEILQASLLLSEPVWSPNMDKIVFWAKDKYTNTISLHLLDVKSLETIDLDLSMNEYWNPIWSPDSSYLAFSGKDNFLIHNIYTKEKHILENCSVDLLGWTLP